MNGVERTAALHLFAPCQKTGALLPSVIDLRCQLSRSLLSHTCTVWVRQGRCMQQPHSLMPRWK